MVMATDLLTISFLEAWADRRFHRLCLQTISTLAIVAVLRLLRLCNRQDLPLLHLQAETLRFAASQVVFSRTVFLEVILNNGQCI